MRQILFTVWAALVFAGCSDYIPSMRIPDGYSRTSQAWQNPFQVIDATNARAKGDTTQLGRLDLIEVMDTIEIKAGGHLIMAHITGKFYELAGDTVVFIQQMARQLTNELNLEEDQTPYRVNLESLFSPRASQISNSSGAVSRQSVGSAIDIISPSASKSIEISSTTPVSCVSWLAAEGVEPPFKVTIKNIFDDQIGEFVTLDSALTIDFSAIDNESGLYILKVEASEKFSSYEYGLKLGSAKIYHPRSCDMVRPIDLLHFAYYMETHTWHNPLLYYSEAANLSDRPIYHELLKLATKHWETRVVYQY